ncbi:MAG TPA: glycoside hydrolase family 38 C-terminal domain-containing protein [Candidatus Acidoferrales bacterium]|nr:glycoside hydrolase family 38 C-terminal domain-containing protein [Candidatus Acidoferrales bacterium]
MQTSIQDSSPVHLVIVPHTHWDREWYQPFQEYRFRLVRLSDRLIDILESDPSFAHFHFDGQSIVLEDYLEIRPEQRSTLRRLTRTGRIAFGPWYVLPDEFLVSGESLIRNLQIGHRVAAEFGAPLKIGYLPDEFGHCAQMPQILAGFGIDSAVVWRGVGSNVTQTLFDWEALDGSRVLAVYLPISGYSNGRNLPDSIDELRAQIGEIIAEQAPFRRIPSLLVMNGTDHQEPLAGLPAALSAATHGLEGITYEMAPLSRFVERARQEHGELELHRGELRSIRRTTLTPGVSSVRIRLKQRDFQNVARLEHYAEPLATWADLRAGKPHLGPFLDWVWKPIVQNHPHDSITGCSVDQVHRDMDARSDQAQLIVNQVTTQAVTALTQELDTRHLAPDAGIAVYNPNGVGPTVVSADLYFDGPPSFVLVDTSGRQVPLHVEASASEVLLEADLPPAEVRPHVLSIQDREFLGMVINDIRLQREGNKLSAWVTLDRMQRGRLDLARLKDEWLGQLDDPTLESIAVHARTGVPGRGTFSCDSLTPHGWTVLRLQRSTSTATESPFTSGERFLENAFYRVSINDDGSLQIVDKQTGLVLPRCNRFVDEGDRGDEYNFDALNGQKVEEPAATPQIQIDAGNPVVASLTLTQTYELPRALESDRETRSPERVPVTITTVAHLYSDVRRVDFETTLDNVVADHRLRVHFETPLRVDSAFMEQAFGLVERGLDLEPPSNFESAIGTVPQKTFACIQDGGRGVALFNRGLPEVEVLRKESGSEIALTLLRCVGWLSRGDLRLRPMPAGPGLETPEAQSLGTHRFEYALTTYEGDWQLSGLVAQAHAYAFPPLAAMTDAHSGSLAEDAALVNCDNSHLVLSALTAGQRPNTFLTRWYNGAATPQNATFSIPRAQQVRAVNFLEEPARAKLRRIGRDTRWRIQLRPFEIVTLQVRL